jgi:hypothetical protein
VPHDITWKRSPTKHGFSLSPSHFSRRQPVIYGRSGPCLFSVASSRSPVNALAEVDVDDATGTDDAEDVGAEAAT